MKGRNKYVNNSLQSVKYKLFILIVGVLCCNSCTKRTQLKDEIVTLQSKEVNLSLDSMHCQINERDTLFTDLNQSKLKLVIFMDSTICSSCVLKDMYSWNELIHWSEQFEKKLGFCFLLNPSKGGMVNLELALRTSNLKHPVFIDTTGIFIRKNPHIPKKQALHTFLLDEENKVILVGDPVRNQKIDELFRKIVIEKLGKKN